MKLLWSVALILAPQLAAADVPPPWQAGGQSSFSVHARGTQNYKMTDGRWVLSGPEADLYDAGGQKVGRHFAGPTWEWEDGSQVTGEVISKETRPNSIPWLLLRAKTHAGAGKLASVTKIQRLHTEGGMPPIKAGEPGATVSVPYQADYTFYNGVFP